MMPHNDTDRVEQLVVVLTEDEPSRKKGSVRNF